MNTEQELEYLRNELRNARVEQRDLFFARLLGGDYFPDEAALRDAAQCVSIDFPHKYFLVLSARPETWGNLFTEGGLTRKDMFFILRNTLENGYPGKTHAADVQGNMVAIINLETLPSPDIGEIIANTETIVETLESEFGITVTVAISRIYDSVRSLHLGMRDVDHIFDYLRLIGEDAPITYYDQLRHMSIAGSTTSYLELETRLLGCFRAADYSGLRQVVHELIDSEFRQTKPTVDTVRFRVYGVVNTMLYLLNDMRKTLGHDFVEALDSGPRLTHAESLEEIVTEIDNILLALEARSRPDDGATVPAWLPKLHQYVEEHFRDPDTTVSFLADLYHITPTYCSKVFRDYYNVRLFDFIQLQRLEAAKALLSSELVLRDIAEQVGFSNVLTMSRAFKRYEGVTPNQLRGR